MRHRVKLTLCLMLPFLTACSFTGQSTKPNDCQIFGPIYLHDGDVLTPDTGKEILNHDDTGHEICDWPYAGRA